MKKSFFDVYYVLMDNIAFSFLENFAFKNIQCCLPGIQIIFFI